MPAQPQHQSQPSGLLVIDKPQGVTSHDLVAAVRGALHTKKVGHAGTLDPMATGVLVIGFGNATRLLNYIVDHDKTYEATIRLGRRTTTDDADGELIDGNGRPVNIVPDSLGVSMDPSCHLERSTAESRDLSFPASVTRDLIERAIAEHLTGPIEQVPNTFSAIKINGQRAYDLARDGKEVELKARPVTIHAFDVLDMRVGFTDAARTDGPLVADLDATSDEPDVAPVIDDHRSTSATGPDMVPVIDLDVRVSCSSGTYIRALGRDLGELLGCGGYLTRLRRTRVGRFDVTAANVVTAHTESRTFTNRAGETVTRNRAVLDVTGDELLASYTMTMIESVRAAMPTLAITAEDAVDLRFGRRIPYDIHEPTAAYVPDPSGDPRAGDVAAIIDRAKRGEAKPIVVFHAD
ncbi:tRNA pseudouridine(55) synthase TruB [Bifidobacterium sp. SO1]|uniref:tRNA pseudouridine synthase B n=1 Tax=Bifidobacterium sp. SO1 TaxID=2809029 RepID=UPI001BDBD358|nr:tRNA pseudouridine(55) synthase TruB [Bifidobacterium sp. SO1]MBT1160490.1 tRNA pseudouridine(55) synthase TruB [Bifidobacterium sp. SO1]